MTEFHIHADLHEPSPEFERFLLGIGAYEDPFLICDSGVVTHEPRYHYTFKFTDSQAFKQRWNQVAEFLDTHPLSWRGYIETEALFGGNTAIADKPFDPSIPLPFIIQPRKLEPGNFRRNELHIYFNDGKTDARIKQAMARIGFFPAWCQGKDGVEGIWTIQAATIGEIVAIRPSIAQFLTDAGGTVSCSIDEERVVHCRLSHPDVSLPPVIGHIDWKY